MQQNSQRLLLINSKLKELQVEKEDRKFTFTSSGLRDKIQYLDQPVFKLAIIIGLKSLHMPQCYTFMITASHNSSQYNGVKIGKCFNTLQNQLYNQIQTLINQQQLFNTFIKQNNRSIVPSKPNYMMFIGRDCRQSSETFQSIIVSAFNILQIPFVLLGRASTPEIFSLSEFYLQSISNSNPSLHQIKESYLFQIFKTFRNCYELLCGNLEIQKEKVLLDFANGSGSISFLPYRQPLLKIFNIFETNNEDFSKPNFECGAEYIVKNWDAINKQNYQQYDNVAFFDGDSDRIIYKIKERENLLDGNQLMAFYSKCLIKILEKIKVQTKITVIGNILMNHGFKKYLQKESIHSEYTKVGIKHLFNKARENQLSIFFQPNGHGGIYYSQQFIKKLQSLQQFGLSDELILLKAIHTIMKNNSKGYALHNFLIIKLFERYLMKSEGKLDWQIFERSHEKQKCYNIPEENIAYVKGQQFLKGIESIRKEFKDYEIILRKSDTERGVFRTNVQGKQIEVCEIIMKKIHERFQPYVEVDDAK